MEELGIDGKIDFTRGRMVKDFIRLCSIDSPDKSPFLLVTSFTDDSKRPKSYDGLVGFGYQCPSSSVGNVDLVQLLTKQGKHSKNIMTYAYDTVSRSGHITLGSIPKAVNTKSKLYRTTPLDVLNRNGHWEVKLHSVYFDDGTLVQIQAPLSIGIGGSAIGVNELLFNVIVEKYFANALNSDKCLMQKGEVTEVFCEEGFEKEVTFGAIHFIVGKWNIEIPAETLFRNIGTKAIKPMWFRVVYYAKDNGKFYITQSVLEGKHAVVYNKEDGVLGFYKEKMRRESD